MGFQRKYGICCDFDGEDFWYSSYRSKEDGLSMHMFGLADI